VVAAAGVDDDHVGQRVELTQHFRQESAFAQRKQPGGVGCVEPTVRNNGVEHGPALEHHGRYPGRVAWGADSLAAAGRGDKHPADTRRPIHRWMPGGLTPRADAELELEPLQLFGTGRPHAAELPSNDCTIVRMVVDALVFDGHNDVISKLVDEERERMRSLGSTGEHSGGRSFFERGDRGHIDLPRAHEGGFGGGLFSIYVAADPQAAPPPGPVLGETEGRPVAFPRPLEMGYAQRTALAQIGLLFRLQRQSEGQLRVVRSVDELRSCMARRVLAAVIHFEGAEAIDPRLDALEVFYSAGLRSLGPVWSRRNDFGEGVPYLFPHSPDTGPGLTDLGKELVRACRRLGILVDVSHINEKGFWDIAAIGDAPLVATHSNAHALTPSPRNLTDRQLDAIKESGGIVGVNFYVGFLRADGRDDPDTPISRIVEHFTYLVERMGLDHVGFGADLDGARIPTEVGDVAGLSRVIAALRAAGYDDSALRKLAHENWLRVLEATWKAA
jgi:membrane dipeptidase